MKTIQHARDGKWHNVDGHCCTTEQELHDYVAALGHIGLRVADESQEGEEAPIVVRKVKTLAQLSEKSRRHIIDALTR